MDYNCHVQKTIFLLTAIALLVSGCSLNLSGPNAGTPTQFIITSTLSSSPPPPLTETAQPATAAPTPAPIEGTTSTQLNVRGEPSTASAPLGMIAAFAKVQIIGKEPGGIWYQIVYAQGPDGKGWVTAQYVDVKDKDAIPVIGGAHASGSGLSGVIIQQVNVRSGPGTDSDALGTLNPKDVVTLTGKDANGIWLQIQYTNGPDGKGWIAAAYVQTSSADSLPIVGQSGEVVGTGTPTIIPSTITPTLIAAPQDNDSAQSPAVNVTFSPSGMRSLIYSSDVSSPDGDPEDWIQFTPYGTNIIASLTCFGNGRLNVELLQNGATVQNWSGLTCGEEHKPLDVTAGQTYLIHLLEVASVSGLMYTHFTITIETAH